MDAPHLCGFRANEDEVMALKIAQEAWPRAALPPTSLRDRHRAVGSWPCVGFTWHAAPGSRVCLGPALRAAPLRGIFFERHAPCGHVCGPLSGLARPVLSLPVLSPSAATTRSGAPVEHGSPSCRRVAGPCRTCGNFISWLVGTLTA